MKQFNTRLFLRGYCLSNENPSVSGSYFCNMKIITPALVLFSTIIFHFPLLSKPIIGDFSSIHFPGWQITLFWILCLFLTLFKVGGRKQQIKFWSPVFGKTGLSRTSGCWWQGPWLLEALAPWDFCVDMDQAETNLEGVRLYYFIVTAITDYRKLSGLKH